MALHVDAVIARITRAQLGLVTRAQALAAGMTKSSIQRRLEAGLWHRIHTNVYAIGSSKGTGEQLALAAVLGVGESAVASHGTALALWDLADIRLGRPYHVLVQGRNQRVLDDVEVHTTTSFRRSDRRKVGPIPVTSVARSIVDAAGPLSVAQLEDITVEALRRRMTKVPQLEACVARFPTSPGTAQLRRTLKLFDPEQVQRLMSRIEAWFLRTVRRLGFLEPIVNRRLFDDHGNLLGKVDFLWEDARVVVEIDGLRFHSTPSQKRYDDRRQNDLVLEGFAVLRYGTWVMDDPSRIRSDLLRALTRQGSLF